MADIWTSSSTEPAAGTVIELPPGVENVTPGAAFVRSKPRSKVCAEVPLLTTRTFLSCVVVPTTSGANVTLTIPASSAFMATTLPSAERAGSTRPLPIRDGPYRGSPPPG